MKRSLLLFFIIVIYGTVLAQKKPLDHSVYDGWQHVGERMISNDGKWVVYTIEPQQGDNELVIQSSDAIYRKTIARGYNAVITEDSRYAIFKIKPFFKDTREAKIKKKKPEDFPKDSFAIVELGKEAVWKLQRVKSYKTPEHASGWVAYQLEKKIELPAKVKAGEAQKKVVDSLNHVIDSLNAILESIPKRKSKKRDDDNWQQDADTDEPGNGNTDTGSDLILRKLENGKEVIFSNTVEYYFSKNGRKLLVEEARNPKDSLSKALVLLYDLYEGLTDTLSRGGNDFRNFTMDDEGMQVAYAAERDAAPKDLLKFYRLWYYKEGMDSAALLVDKNSAGMDLGMTISENATLHFSKSGQRLFFGTVPLPQPKDTTLVDFEHPKVDIWHYNDDYLQTVQLKRLQNDLKKSYQAVYDFTTHTMQQLGSEQLPQVMETDEGDGEQFVGVTDYGKRIESQWTGNTLKDVYAIDVKTGSKKLVKENLDGIVFSSSTGRYIMWYDLKAHNYFVWNGSAVTNITAKIKTPLWNEESEVPDDPGPYGVMGWQQGDSAVYVYDKFDVWKADLNGNAAPVCITNGRKYNIIYRYVRVNPEENFFGWNQSFVFKTFNDLNKQSGLYEIMNDGLFNKYYIISRDDNSSIGQVAKAKNNLAYLFTKENFSSSPDLYVASLSKKGTLPQPGKKLLAVDMTTEVKLSSINPQQKNYNWGKAELVNWKAYNGKPATGILYKPEDFDPKKKYPMICYFYETLSDNLNHYYEPAPIRSAINIPFFVSRGYIIFVPDIHYGTGHPGKDAYNYIVSGARAMAKKGFVDSTRMAIQGHSWGGYQVAQLVTMTKLFKAAWAGAPVANMTSAYGGIRWESGLNRQFQYEKTQSRIGATLWEKPQLYIENSPLFHLDKVTTPLVIMANDADGAVPWYQGIELFTAMRRLHKKIWMFDYNGEGHGLTQRQDMLDYQIRMQQFFDWILKGDKPAKWITDGVPAVEKGKDWGLEIVD